MGRKRKHTGRKNLICEWCGKLLKNHQRQCCSRSCSAKMQPRRPMSQETKDKMSRSHTGFTHSQETKDKISQTKMGHEVSQETRDKMSKALSGRTLSDDHKVSISKSMTFKERSEVRKSTYENYVYDPDKPQSEYRRKAIETYGYVCSGCGCTNGQLVVHHINGDHEDDRIENLVVLCRGCHSRIHRLKYEGDPTPDSVMTNEVLQSRVLSSNE